MTRFLTIFFLLKICFCFAQTIKIDYDFTPNYHKFEEMYAYPVEIMSNGTELVYTLKSMELNGKSMDYDTDHGRYITYFESDHNPVTSINLINGHIVEEKFIYGKKFIVLDSLQIHWELEEGNEKEFLGLKCKMATTKFRGRTYYVWYTEEIPLGIGPWKLQGLPGVVLYAKDSEEKITFEATKINMNHEVNQEFFTNKKENLLAYKDVISFDEFKTKWKNFVTKMKKEHLAWRLVMTQMHLNFLLNVLRYMKIRFFILIKYFFLN